jgi:aldehyde dehydrogenase (NAD+)
VYYKGEVSAERRRMGISILKMNKGGEGEDGGVMREEVFGPVLPVISVKVCRAAKTRSEGEGKRGKGKRRGSG